MVLPALCKPSPWRPGARMFDLVRKANQGRPGRAREVIRATARFQARGSSSSCGNRRGIRPDWWKLPGQKTAQAWQRISAVIEEFDPHCRGIVIIRISWLNTFDDVHPLGNYPEYTVSII